MEMKKKSSIIDVARTAGVSPATVSRVFNNHPYVKDDVRDAVLGAARKINYAPQSTKPKNSIGILVHGEKYLALGTYETQLVVGISGELFNHGLTTEITTDQQAPLFHRNSFQVLIALSTVDRNISELGIPLILVNNKKDGVHSVVTDHFQGIELAVEHLVAAGHKRIAYIAGISDSWGAAERLRGYQETLIKHNIEYEESLHFASEKSNVIATTEKVLEQNPTAIILSGEGRAQYLTYALHNAGKKIPDDISVISFEDREVSPYLIPPHTTISQNIPNIAKAVAGVAMDIIINKSNRPLQNITLTNDLIIRESVKQL